MRVSCLGFGLLGQGSGLGIGAETSGLVVFSGRRCVRGLWVKIWTLDIAQQVLDLLVNGRAIKGSEELHSGFVRFWRFIIGYRNRKDSFRLRTLRPSELQKPLPRPS